MAGYVCTSIGCWQGDNLKSEYRGCIQTTDLIAQTLKLRDEIGRGEKPEGWEVAAGLGAFLVNRLIVPHDATEAQATILVFSAFAGALYAYAEESLLRTVRRP